MWEQYPLNVLRKRGFFYFFLYSLFNLYIGNMYRLCMYMEIHMHVVCKTMWK